MPVIESVKNRAQFERVLRTGARARSDGVTAVAIRRGDDGATRLGLAVKARSGAVARNRVRRRLREVWRSTELPVGYDVVLQAGETTNAMGFETLRNHVQRAAARALSGTG